MLIYLVTNLVNSKAYVGQTTDTLEGRWKSHLYEAAQRPLLYFHKAIRKYGESNFRLEVLSTVTSQDQLNSFERLWILTLGTYNPQVGYNMTYGGDAFPLTKEAKKKQAEAIKQAWTAERREKRAVEMKGNKFHLGIAMAEETKLKIGLANKGKRPADTTIEAARRVNSARVHTPEEKEKRASKHRGIKRPDVSERMKGNKFASLRKGSKQSDGTKQLQSIATKKKWAERKAQGFNGRLESKEKSL